MHLGLLSPLKITKRPGKDLLEVKDNHVKIREPFKHPLIEEVIEVKDSITAFKRCSFKLEERTEAANASKGTMKIMI